MLGGKSTGSEVWFKAVCLVASVGLHAGLGLFGWQGVGTAPPESAPIMVSLAVGAETVLPQAPATAAQGIAVRAARPPGKVAPPRSNLPQPPQPVATVQPAIVEEVEEVLQCALPETTVGEDLDSLVATEPAIGGVAEAGGADILEAGGPVTGLSIGTAAGEGAESGSPVGRLVLATPRYASNPKPEYPRLARLNHWEGVVYLRAAISAAGEVESVVVENSSGHQLLDRSAVGGVRRWRFVPARRGDLRVPCEVRIPVAFQLDR